MTLTDFLINHALCLSGNFHAFFRLHSASVIDRLRDAYPDLPANPTAQEVFVKLRELRNTW